MDYKLEEYKIENIFNIAKILFIPNKENKYSPKFLNNRMLFYFIILLFVLNFLIFIVSFNFPRYVFFADITKIDLINMINNQRTLLGIKPLGENSILDKAAMQKAKDMLNNGYFSHQSPTGTTPWFWIENSGYNYKYAGENLAIGFTESTDVYNAWFESESHRVNFLNSNYDEVGTAVVTGNFNGNIATIVVQMFGKRDVSIQQIANTKNENKTENQLFPDKDNLDNIENKIDDNKMVLPAFNEKININSLNESYKIKNDFSKILNILFYEYEKVLKKINFYIFIVVSFLSITNIVVNYNYQNRKLVFRSLLMVVILGLNNFIEKDQIINLLYNNF